MMVRFFGSYIDVLPNKVTIVMHIIAYLFIIVVNVVLLLWTPVTGLKFFEISAICAFVAYFVCVLIFGLIVNTIVTKIEKGTNSSDTSSLLDSDSESFLGPE